MGLAAPGMSAYVLIGRGCCQGALASGGDGLLQVARAVGQVSSREDTRHAGTHQLVHNYLVLTVQRYTHIQGQLGSRIGSYFHEKAIQLQLARATPRLVQNRTLQRVLSL